MDTVIAPFLDTYHRNIQISYQQMTEKILKRIKDEINAAVVKKNKIYTALTILARNLTLPAMCNEDHRKIKTLANKHVAKIYVCTEEARKSIAKMGIYAQEMINITKKHMEGSLVEAAKFIDNVRQRILQRKDINACLKQLSREAVLLGYELDLSLTNARRHNEQSCEKISVCSTIAKRSTDDAVVALKDELLQCVYA
ncbi:uncharacterized protein LOC114243872 [Bombyx mandarina]|uniref:Uncharacterized protein LOC114243872 n=1 Tax=Bombyx mandarina TaxID=7092 RepID=A0A6J2JQM5_BOMMA|nr:uncharacterized protein LOC114243872 [Bombyx mandarina]